MGVETSVDLRISGFGLRISDVGFRVQGFGFAFEDTGSGTINMIYSSGFV